MRNCVAAVLAVLILSAAAVACVWLWADSQKRTADLQRYYLISHGNKHYPVGFLLDRKTGKVVHVSRKYWTPVERGHWKQD